MQAYASYYKSIFHFFSLLYVRIEGKNITFNKKNIKKSNFYNKKCLLNKKNKISNKNVSYD